MLTLPLCCFPKYYRNLWQNKISLTDAIATLIKGITLNGDRAVPAVIFLSRSIRASSWSSHPSLAHCDLQWPQPPQNPHHQTDWEDWEDWELSAKSALLRRGLLTLCPAPRRLRKRVSQHVSYKRQQLLRLQLVFIRICSFHSASSQFLPIHLKTPVFQ